MARHLISSGLVLKRTKPKPATFRISDGDGLYLLVRPDAAKWWRFDYFIAGKRKTLPFGEYMVDRLSNNPSTPPALMRAAICD